MNKEQILKEFSTGKFFQFSFQKADGSVRQALGTLDSEYINNFWESSGNGYEEAYDIIRYFDVDAEGWRSFKVERFLEIEGTYNEI